jgi:iron complex outermembrane receptor protein
MYKSANQSRYRHVSTLFAGVGLAALLGAIAPAYGETAAAPAAPAQAGSDSAPSSADIVVTARRIDEKLRDVPVAVAAFGAKALAEQRIDSEADLQIATPGLTVRATSSSNQLNYAIRGQSVDSFSYSPPAVVAYFNNVPTGGTTATAFFDLESIQVLKGPQGTLFGRNATGGAVLYQSVKPSEQFGGYLTAGYGNYNNREAEGAINIPIADGIAVRLSGKDQQRDGFQHNLLNNTYINSIDEQAGRIGVLIKPTGSGFENDFEYQRGVYGGYSGGLKMQNANGVNGAPSTYYDPISGTTKNLTQGFAQAYGPGVVSSNPAVNALFAGTGIPTGIGGFLTLQAKTFGFYDVALNQNDAHHATQDFLSNTTSYKLGANATIKNIFGYNRVLSQDNTDIAGAPYEWLEIGGGPAGSPYNGGYTYGTKQWSDELQISGTALDGKLKYVAGVFASDEKTYNRIPLAIVPDLTPGTCATGVDAGYPYCGAGFQGSYDFTQDDKSKAIYAQVSYELAPKLNFSAGIRYTKDDVSISYGTDPYAINNQIEVPASKSASKPSWLIGLDYKLTPDLLVYFNQRGSWRTGGYNGTAPPVANPSTGAANYPESFGAETTYDFELGAKYAGTLGTVPASVNLAVYDQEISNVQRSPYLGISAIAVNVPHARVRGVELDGSIRPTNWLEFGGAFTYTDALYTSNIVVTQSFGTYSFGPYGDTPKVNGSAFFRAATALPGEMGEVALRGELYAQSSFYYSNTANTTSPGTQIAGYSLLNARLEWNKINGSRVSVAAFINNITNKDYYTGGLSLSSVTGGNAALTGTPRMYGFDLNVKF